MGLVWRGHRHVRLAGALLLIVAALIWAYTGYTAYWDHMAGFARWLPATMR